MIESLTVVFSVAPALFILAACFYAFALAMLVKAPRIRVASLLPMGTSPGHIPIADVLRGLAALWVALLHMVTWTPWLTPLAQAHPILGQGEKAVPVFVVLSGFLVYRACRPTDAAALRRYLMSRLLRIYPLYIAVTILTFALVIVVADGSPQAPGFEPWRLIQYAVSQALMLNALGLQVFPVPQFWSLYVEVVFYIMLPAWVAFFQTSPAGQGGRWGHAALLLAMAGLLHISGFSGARTLQLWAYFPLGMAASHLHDWLAGRPAGPGKTGIATAAFCLGLLLAFLDMNGIVPDIAHSVCLSTSPEIRANIQYVFLGQHLGPGVAVACDTAWPVETANTLWIGIATAAILVGGASLGLIKALSGLFPARLLAAISYSVFAWHGALLALMGVYPNGTGGTIAHRVILPVAPDGFVILVLVPALLTVACISYLLIERPALMLKSRMKSRPEGDRDGD